MVKKHPLNSNWTTNNTSVFNGDIVQSYGINLSRKEGFLVAGSEFVPHTTNSDVGSLTVPSSFCNIAGRTYMAADTIYYTDDLSTTKFAADAVTGHPTAMYDTDIALAYSDGSFISSFIVTTGVSGGLAYVYAKYGPTAAAQWTTIATLDAHTASNRYPLAMFQRSILVCEGVNAITQVLINNDSTYTVTSKYITLPRSMQIQWIKVTYSQVFIGCVDTYYGDKFVVFRFDPFSLQQSKMTIDAVSAVPFIYADNIYLLDSKGIIWMYNGMGFSQFGVRFPGSYAENVSINTPHRNGITVSDSLVRFLMPATFPYIYGGVWTLDMTNKRLYHEFGAQQSATTQVDYGTVNLTQTGAMIKSTSFSSYTTTGAYTNDGEFIGGLSMKTSASASLIGVFSSKRAPSKATSFARRGWFVTPRLSSEDGFIDGQWHYVFLRYIKEWFPFGSLSGTLRVGYKITEGANDQTLSQDTCTWVNSTSYTTTATQIANVSIGDYFFITNGQGAGYGSYITNITGTTTKTVTFKDAIPLTCTGTFNVLYSSFQRITAYDNDETISIKEYYLGSFPDNIHSDWVQLLIELDGTVGLEEYNISYKNNLLIDKLQ